MLIIENVNNKILKYYNLSRNLLIKIYEINNKIMKTVCIYIAIIRNILIMIKLIQD